MLTPNNESGDKTDKIMLLAMWVETLRKEHLSKSIIAAGMGKPTFPVNIHTVQMYLQYWNSILERLNALSDASESIRAGAAIDYGDPRGDFDAKTVMAQAMTRWYKSEVLPENILFTVGGAGAIRIIFETLNELNKNIPAYRVITPFPHYTLYKDNRHKLHPVNVLDQPGYRLTGKALEESIEQAYELAKKDNNLPKSILLCNPNNPLGTAITEKEWLDIIPALRKYPDLKIIIDEAYAEMCWSEDSKSTLITLAPDLKERVVMFRSATKAHSAAGERMAMLMAFDKSLMVALTNKNISVIGHAPRSAQIAYAYTMEKFGEPEARAMKEFYKPKVDYVAQRLQGMKATLPDPAYHIDGTFYVMADLSDLYGMEIPEEAKRALGKTDKIRTSEELAYTLLFNEALMIAPGEYFGLPKDKGYIRITCSGAQEELVDMMNRIESVLLTARRMKYDNYMNQIISNLEQLRKYNPTTYTKYLNKVAPFHIEPDSCAAYVERNIALKNLASELKVVLMRATPDGLNMAAHKIRSFFRKSHAKIKEIASHQNVEIEWQRFVDQTVSDGPVKNYFLNLQPEERKSIKPWVEHLEKMDAKDRKSKI